MIESKKDNLIRIVDPVLSILFAGLYFCLEPMLSQVYLIRGWSIVYWPYMAVRYICIPLIYVLFIIKVIKSKGKINYGALGAILVLYLCYLISCISKSESSRVWIETVGQNMAYFIFILPLIENEKYWKKFISACSWLYLVLATVNLIFKIAPNLFEIIGSWTPESFISTIENLAGFPLVMGVFFCLLDSYYGGCKVKLYVYLIVYFVSNYLLWTAAQIVGAFVVFLYMLPPIRYIFNKIDIFALFSIALAMFVIFVWFWEPIMDFPPIKFLMESVLKKDVTFSGRLYIWQNIWEMTKEKLLFGHGLMENPQMIFYEDRWNWNWVHAHNAFLQTMYEGGIFTIAGLIGLFTYTSKKIRKNLDKTLIGICNISIFVFLINMEMDQFFIYPWRSCMWCMICFICNVVVAEANKTKVIGEQH